MYYSVIICDEVIDADMESNKAKLSPKDDDKTNFNEMKATCKTQVSIFYLHFY